MGKSPAKWIKTVLFGKKSSRSNSTKKGVNEKKSTGEKAPVPAESSPVISDPVLVTSHAGAKEEIQISESQLETPVTNQEIVATQTAADLNPSENQEKVLVERAAVKAQAAFRGYLARRAFKALKGIIRLQALIRGHLVRRQAVTTLRALYYIVRIQALARGIKTRNSRTGFIGTSATNLGVKKCSDVWKEYSSANPFAKKLLSYGTKVECLHFQYEIQDPNSAFSWSTRWTLAKTWKPIPGFKKPVSISDSKSQQSRRSSYAMETESGKLKRKSYKSPSVGNTETGQTGQRVGSRKSSAESAAQEGEKSNGSPLTELEKVKRNLRKVTSLVPDSSNNSEIESSERNSLSVREIVVPVPNVEINNNNNNNNGNLPEKARKSSTGTIVLPEIKPKREKEATETESKREKEAQQFTETNEETLKPEGHIGQFTELDSPVEEKEKPLERNNTEEIETLISKEEPNSTNKTGSKRRSSLSLSTPPNTKTELSESKDFTQTNNNTENNNSGAPAVPSYMAMTKSAKTKLKAQNSPKFASESNGSNGSTRRHSLPNNNSGGKLSSQSPRTRPLVQVKAGGLTKSGDKAMHSSTDKPIVEWRR
ncbi:hypothetical protein LUZ60_000407 [Juncus effusus]|nr:hypothetical protein LUZ60_000407 [Juncus effusus]